MSQESMEESRKRPVSFTVKKHSLKRITQVPQHHTLCVQTNHTHIVVENACQGEWTRSVSPKPLEGTINIEVTRHNENLQ